MSSDSAAGNTSGLSVLSVLSVMLASPVVAIVAVPVHVLVLVVALSSPPRCRCGWGCGPRPLIVPVGMNLRTAGAAGPWRVRPHTCCRVETTPALTHPVVPGHPIRPPTPTAVSPPVTAAERGAAVSGGGEEPAQ
jgi:hypothetical protein